MHGRVEDRPEYRVVPHPVYASNPERRDDGLDPARVRDADQSHQVPRERSAPLGDGDDADGWDHVR